jgi:hypothetical protein
MATPALADKDALPFKAKTDVVFSEPSTACETGYDGTYTEHIGTGTHLGRFHLDETLCVNASGFPVIVFYVTGTLVAANGDELYFDTEGELNMATGVMTSTGWLFDGGTGRFENASGQADETLIRNPPVTGPIIGIIAKGTISYDASDRSN